MSGAVLLWRIAAESKQYKANDLSGRGAAKYPGRWNASGERVVYAAQSLALAVLETAAHINDAGLPLNRFVVEITVPARVWAEREVAHIKDIDPAWSAVPNGKASIAVGSAWYRNAASALLLVPSVVVQEEFAVVINATHPDAKHVKAKTVRAFEFNKLFRS